MSNILESALHEAVHYREIDVLKSTPEEDLRAYLQELWQTVADFDILLEAGHAMGSAGILGACPRNRKITISGGRKTIRKARNVRSRAF